MTTARISAGVPTGGQFATNGHAEADITLPGPVTVAPRVPTDRETLDSIAIMMAESQDWDADLTDDIAREIARSGRPHPGDSLDDDEVALLEDRGDDVEQAAGQKYQNQMNQQRADAASDPLRVDPTDTVALLNAHAARSAEAQRATELTAAKAIAQTVKSRWPDAAYLQFAAQYEAQDEDDHFPEAVLDKDFNVIVKRPYLRRAATDPSTDLDALSAHLTSNGHWDEYRTIGPADPDGYSPLLKVDEAAGINSDDQGAGAAIPPPAPGETLPQAAPGVPDDTAAIAGMREGASRAVAAAAERMNRATALEAEVNGGKTGGDPSVRAGYRAQIARMRARSAQQYLRDLEVALGIGPARR